MIVVVNSAIIQRADSFLLVKETKPAAAGKWGLPGGKLEEGESIIDGVRREVQEETGYGVTSERLLCIINKPKTHEGNTVIKFVFVCSVSENPTTTAEHEYEFLSVEAVNDLAAQGLIRGDEVPQLLDASASNQQRPEQLLRIVV